MPSSAKQPRANDCLKERFEDVLAVSLIVATVAHFLVLQMWPALTVADWRTSSGEAPRIVHLDPIPLPAPPAILDRPATPVVVPDAHVDATLPVVDFVRVGDLPPPPLPTDTESEWRRPFTPFEVPPRLANPDAFQRALLRAYPESIRSAGIGGTVVLLAHIDERGRVLEARIGDSSGYESLDQTALSLVDVMRFTPALNRDRRVAVWVELPIEFRVREDAAAARPTRPALSNAVRQRW